MINYRNEFSLDDVRTTLWHREIILQKAFLKKIYKEWYNIFIAEKQTLPNGLLVEIGSGGGFLKDIFPEVITSDVQQIEHCDKCFSAEDIPFEDKSVAGYFMINVLHHIPHPELFLKEAERTMMKGGKIVMIEPANSFWGRFIYKNFHHEPFNPVGGWEIESTGPLSGANGAIPWIIFERDREQFKTQFPEFRIESIRYIMPLRYLLSGGVSRRALVPKWSFGFFKIIERMLRPVSKYFSMFMVIKIVKNSDA